jgi:hypothetical protein
MQVYLFRGGFKETVEEKEASKVSFCSGIRMERSG